MPASAQRRITTSSRLAMSEYAHRSTPGTLAAALDAASLLPFRLSFLGGMACEIRRLGSLSDRAANSIGGR